MLVLGSGFVFFLLCRCLLAVLRDQRAVFSGLGGFSILPSLAGQKAKSSCGWQLTISVICTTSLPDAGFGVGLFRHKSFNPARCCKYLSLYASAGSACIPGEGGSFKEVTAIACEFRLLVSVCAEFQLLPAPAQSLPVSTVPPVPVQSTVAQSSGSTFQPTQDMASQIQDAVEVPAVHDGVQSVLAYLSGEQLPGTQRPNDVFYFLCPSICQLMHECQLKFKVKSFKMNLLNLAPSLLIRLLKTNFKLHSNPHRRLLPIFSS